MGARDRLLLAFANLGSYGILARPAVGGSFAEADGIVSSEAARKVPFARSDYVFWLHDEESWAFDRTGALVGPLRLHFGNRSIAPAIEAALSSAGLSGQRAARGDAILVYPISQSEPAAATADGRGALTGPHASGLNGGRIPTFDAGGSGERGVRSLR
jgi:hypothetical protein